MERREFLHARSEQAYQDGLNDGRQMRSDGQPAPKKPWRTVFVLGSVKIPYRVGLWHGWHE